MKIQIITLFPKMFDGPFAESMLLKAQKLGLVEIELINLRDYGLGPRKTVDDTPYGGGDGMLLRPEPIAAALEQAKRTDPEAIAVLLTPAGRVFNQSLAREFSRRGGLIMVCGRYEGVDQRVSTLVDMELSIGDYVLTGGEIAAMAVTDAVVRLVPGVLGGPRSAEIESFSQGRALEYPQYTRPKEWNGQKVPNVLLSGDHAAIASWRQQQAAKKTVKRSRLAEKNPE